MADEPKQGAEANPIALAGGIPAAEGFAASAGILSNISATLQSIMKNPFFAQEGVQQISRRWDEHIIKRLKEMNNLTGKSAEAFDKLARSGEGMRTMFSRIDGVVMGAGLRVAFLNEQLERQAATIGKYARLQDLSGGSYFNEARRMQAQYYGNVATYGKAAAEQMKQVEMQLNTSMFAASGITDPDSRSNYAKAMGMYNQMYGGNAGGFVANLFSKYRSRGMNLGKAQDLLEQLRTRTEGKQIFNEQGFQGVQQEFLQLSDALGSTGMGYSGAQNLSAAANLMQATRGMGAKERGNVYSMMTSSMLSGSTQASKLGMGMGMNPLAFSKMIQSQMLEDPEKAVLTVAKAINRAIDKVPPEMREHWMQLMGIGNVEELKFWKEEVPGAVKHVDQLGVSLSQLSDVGKKVGPDLQKVQEDAKDLFDVVGGKIGQVSTNGLGSQAGKYIGYGTSALSLVALLAMLKSRKSGGGGALATLLGFRALQDLVKSPEVTRAGQDVEGGEGTIEKVTDVVTSVITAKTLLKGRGAAEKVGEKIGGKILDKFGKLIPVAEGAAGVVGAGGLLTGAIAIGGLLVGGALALAASEGLHAAIGQKSIYGQGYGEGQHDVKYASMDRPENIKFNNIKFNKNPFPPGTERAKNWQEQQERNENMHRRATETKWKMENYPQYKQTPELAALADKATKEHFALPSSYSEGNATPASTDLSEITGNTGLVTIQIVGPGGEDLGKKTVNKGQQVHFRLTQGQIQGVTEE